MLIMRDESNPYQVPTDPSGETSAEESTDNDSSEQPIVRKGVVPILGVLWNLPLLLLIVLMFSGRLDEEKSEFLMVCWGGTLPFACIAAAYSPKLQRFLFVPDVDVQKLRRGLCSVAILWTVLAAVGIYFTLPWP